MYLISKTIHQNTTWTNYLKLLSTNKLQHLLQPWFSEDPQGGFTYYVFSVCWLTTSPKQKIHLISVKCYLSDLSRFSQGYRVGLIHPCFRVTSVWDCFNIHRHNSIQIWKREFMEIPILNCITEWSFQVVNNKSQWILNLVVKETTLTLP